MTAMRLYWSSNDHSGLRMAPAVLGAGLILLGIVFFVWHNLLSYVLAVILCGVGISLLTSAWRLRRSPTDPNEPIEGQWRVRDPSEE